MMMMDKDRPQPGGTMATPSNSDEDSSDDMNNRPYKGAKQIDDGSVHDSASSNFSSANDSNQQSASSVHRPPAADLGEQELAAAKLSKQVFRFKVMVWIVLLLAAVAVAVSIFVSTRRDEESTYEAVFVDHTSKIMETFTRNMERKLGVLDFLSVSATMESGRPNRSWPDFEFPNFEFRAANALELTDGAMIAIVPIVNDRESWEAFAVESTTGDDSWIVDAKLFQASFRRMEETVMCDREKSAPAGRPLSAGCREDADDREGSGAAIVDEAASEQRGLQATEPVTFSDSGVPTKIYKLDDSSSSIRKRRIVDPSVHTPFLPIWQHYPLAQSLINYNLNSDAAFRNECSAILENPKSSVLGRIWYLQDDDETESIFFDAVSKRSNKEAAELASTPFSKVFYPIFDSNQNLVAILTSIIDWSTYFRDVLPPHSDGIQVVLKNECGNVHTFQINGESAISLGKSDLHDSDYNNMAQTRTLKSLLDSPDTTNYIHFDDSYCPYTITVYPSDTFKGQFITNNAIYYMLAVIGVFAFTLLIFTLYDWYVERRQQLIMKRAIQSRAIVSSLFPAAIQERLFRSGASTASNRNDQDKATGMFQWMRGNKSSASSSNHHRTSNHSNHNNTTTKKMKLTDVLLNTETMDVVMDGTTPIHELKPIADLFPHTTVLFADIAGFTRWSSKRKPEHVFTLLQTVYHAFDRIAKRRGVFKVETIGDCYVAVTGLPDPQPDHAVRMVKFANECRTKMTDLVVKLKIGLGDDTTQLAMRFGLHSGPVTAGVLRGERSRFQLFGNTVNIAARMENTGLSNKIHATQEVSDLVAAAGNVHWVEQRVVDVADRGGFQTYFIEPNNGDGVSKQEEERPSKSQSHSHDESSYAKESKSSNADFRVRSKPRPSISSSSTKQRERRHINRETRRVQLDDKEKHLVEWNLDLFKKMLQQILAHRQACQAEGVKAGHNLAAVLLDGANIRSEVSSVIAFPPYNKEESRAKVQPNSIKLDEIVEKQLRDFISFVASMHRDNSFHNFTRSSNVCVAVNKHIQRIVDDGLVEQLNEPLSKFAILFAALTHGIGHPGVPNEQLVKEDSRIATLYQNKSVSQQNAIDLAFSALMDTDYAELQSAIFTDESEVHRFRKIVVNCIIATDLYDRELVVDRNKRWLYAFLEQGSPYSGEDKQNLLATVVMEAVVQASHYGHALQYFLSYKLWNERYFREMYNAFKCQRLEEDPSADWHAKELLFLDEIIIPLARKLKESKVLGTAGDDALTYALTNRKEWAAKGNGISAEFVERFKGTNKKKH